MNEISAYAYTPVDPGLFGVGMTLPGEKVRPALTESLRTLAQLATAPPTEEELATIKALVESEAVYARETVQGLARKLGHYETTLGGYEAEEKYHARVAALTPDAVWQVARRYVDFDTAVVTGLLPAGAQLTEVEVHAALDEARREPGVTTPARRAQTVPAAAMPRLKGIGPEAGTDRGRDTPQRCDAHPPRGARHAAGGDARGLHRWPALRDRADQRAHHPPLADAHPRNQRRSARRRSST